VIVDMGAEMGGNCELTRPGATLTAHGVTIHGPINLAATLPVHASQMYARNVSSFLLNLVKDGALALDFNDEIVRESCVTHQGRVLKGGAAPASGDSQSPKAGALAGATARSTT